MGESWFEPGQQVVLRETWEGRVWSAKPAIVVRDDAEITALYIPPGTRWKRPEKRDGEPLPLPTGDWTLRDDTWDKECSLRLTVPGLAQSVLANWSEDFCHFKGWYVNLEEPATRTPIGFDTMDHALDLIIEPDLSAWRWKDESDFEEAQALGVFSSEAAQAIMAEGERAIERVRRREPPFGQGWERWKPSRSWPIPELPANWETCGLRLDG